MRPLYYTVFKVKYLSYYNFTNDDYSYHQEVELQLNILKGVLFKIVHELQTVTMEEKAIVSEIEGTRSSLKNFNNQLHKLDFETLKQQEIMYSQVDATLINIFHIEML